MGIIKKGVGCGVVLVGGFFLVSSCVAVIIVGSSQDDSSTDTTTPGRAAPTTPAADDHATIPGDGTHQMGGMDGKDWGVYEATATSNCQWSIRSVARYRPGLVLDEGTAAPGETVRVNIQPDGKVSVWDGTINGDHRLVFMTNGCGKWQFVR
ncbi:hypothetical protein ABQE48_21365 [Mycolicibacterium thermoresistibile]